MHDDRALVEARLGRVLDERLRPAAYPECVPLGVAVWHAPGEPVPVAEGLAAEPEPVEVGARWGTSWFRVTGADQGVHRFRHALVPGASIGDAVREGWRINLPERRLTGAGEVAPLVTADRDAAVVTVVKLADDGSGDVVPRFHGAHGARARATLTTGFAATGVEVTDLLERPLADARAPLLDGSRITVRLRPFQLMTLRLKRA